MLDNIRFIFSGLWFPATALMFAGIALFVLTLGDYWQFCLGAVLGWVIISTVIWVVSLNA